MPKPGPSRYLTFATNPILSNFIGKFFFSCKLRLFVRIIFFENKTNFSLTCFKNQIKLKNSYQISFILCKILTFRPNCIFLGSVILHKLTTIAFTDMHSFGLA